MLTSLNLRQFLENWEKRQRQKVAFELFQKVVKYPTGEQKQQIDAEMHRRYKIR